MVKQRALVVEDREDWQGILSRTLETLGWQVDIASNYEDALNLLEEESYDLAVVDPVLDNSNKYNRDGLRVLVEIHRQYPQIPVIVVSGSVNTDVLNAYPDLPLNIPLIEKPKWDREAFITLVRHTNLHKESPMRTSTVFRLLKSVQKFTPLASTKDMPNPPREEDRRGKPRFLIVEDRPDWQVILARTLEDEGWFWRYVQDAGTALHLLRDKEMVFHVVLLDLRLGDADIPLQEGEGWKLLDYLAVSGKRTRVIIVSGEASRGDVATLFTKYPIEGFVDKDSFKKNELLELVYKLISKPKINIQTLGAFQVRRDDRDINDFGSHEAELLLKILISYRGQVVPKDKLVRWLFPFTHTGLLHQPKPALKAIVNTVCHLLEPDLAHPEDSAFIVETDEGYSLDLTQPLILDFMELEAMLEEGKTIQLAEDDEKAMQIYQTARELHQGEYLPNDRRGQWSIALRTHVEKQYARVLNRLADLHAKKGNFKLAVEITQECLQVDSYHESTHRRMMRYQYCLGNKDAALIFFNTLEKLQREFFQEEPSPQTKALRDAIMAGHDIDCVEPTDQIPSSES